MTLMKPKLLLIIAVFLLTVGAGAGNKAGASASAPMVNHSAVSGSALLTPARWACWAVPGSGMGRQCRWVGRRWRGPGSGTGPAAGPGPRCWIERIPGSGQGPQRVCR
jgi:hypothetical protein